ncbi:MAG: permease [Chloroflexi bacterium AL-W]|nr:permease [Chloroflexi bacterium AL-N1]NOK68388.1 permease [Chloroflexi bacterium AL-N10]NOK74034.1 permease [Chloroflexi bacterium AL-N5]NOK83002.1 permease [Chloroflexi bacterium AL-W]NOK90524.1 permease [Chloroflexi bacterium AL-N15]
MAVDATLGVTDLVEAMHHTITRLGTSTAGRTQGITGLVYGSIRGVTRLVGSGTDVILTPLAPLLGEQLSSPEREAVISALNGVLGDHLAANDNPLAIRMHLRQDGQPLDLEAQTLHEASPQASNKILLMVHGLCLNDLHWLRNGHNHGAMLATELGYTPIYLHYNTGLHISTNGRTFADIIETLLHRWPVPVDELAIIGHSMGGLVSRSACYYGTMAGHTWLRYLHKMVFLGTPHHGSPLEQHGNGLNSLLEINPYTAAFTRLAKIRSAGITDLRHGNLLDEDWAEQDRFAHAHDQRRLVPLPNGVQCYAIGVTTGDAIGDLRDQLFGDGLVSLQSALGYHKDPERIIEFPETNQWIGHNMNHMDLLDQPEVYEQIRQSFIS